MANEKEYERSSDNDGHKEVPILPHATQKSDEENRPPLYISGFGIMGQSTPDVATGSTPVTRKDD